MNGWLLIIEIRCAPRLYFSLTNAWERLWYFTMYYGKFEFWPLIIRDFDISKYLVPFFSIFKITTWIQPYWIFCLHPGLVFHNFWLLPVLCSTWFFNILYFDNYSKKFSGYNQYFSYHTIYFLTTTNILALPIQNCFSLHPVLGPFDFCLATCNTSVLWLTRISNYTFVFSPSYFFITPCTSTNLNLLDTYCTFDYTMNFAPHELLSTTCNLPIHQFWQHPVYWLLSEFFLYNPQIGYNRFFFGQPKYFDYSY